mgnify:CR=1 FL=1
MTVWRWLMALLLWAAGAWLSWGGAQLLLAGGSGWTICRKRGSFSSKPGRGTSAMALTTAREDAADLVRYRHASPDEVLRCEECNRILVRTAESGL